MNAQVWDFPGGIHPADNKRQSTAAPIQHPPLPTRLILPLAQHIGEPARPCVEVGQRVLKGQLIAEPGSAISAALHAPTSGIVAALGEQPYPYASGLPAPAIVIDADGHDEWATLEPCANYGTVTASDLLERIRLAGIAGLGGAGFPTAAKLATRPQDDLHTLIINAAECEPYISADDMLMRERAQMLVQGIDILMHILQPEQVLLGIEDNKPEALAAVQAALGERNVALRSIPTKYPSGGERQLIQVLTGREVPSGGLPADIGMLCVNVGTAVAVADAILYGRPLISRVTTLTGAALANPGNVEALIGTPVGVLLDFAGLDSSKLDRLIMGGPLMGVSLPSLDVPLLKTSNCLLAPTRDELPPAPPAMPCIRCGDCAQVCPASLLPQQLHFFALGENHEQLHAHNLFDCIECGACAYVCPSSIPLVQYYRAAKADIRELERRQLKADQSRLRFEQRQERLRHEEQRRAAERQARQERAARLREEELAPAQTEALAAQAVIERVKSEKSVGNAPDQLKRLKIEASMAQVALKKAERQLASHDTGQLRAQVAELRDLAEQAKAALAAAEACDKAAASPAAPLPVADDGALKKARIDAAMARARLKKSEKAFGESPTGEQRATLESLREEIERIEQHLAGLQAAAPAPPQESPSEGVLALRQAKQHYVAQRDALREAERSGATEADMARLRVALADAESALHAAEDASGKAPPELVRTDKRPVNAAMRAAKTELAYARADLKKLEREGADDTVLATAQARLQAAERALANASGEE
ncbi:electron transport complex subunit RsxC [Pseudomonas sp. ZM23]|uniref:Ion-translocating oxidoreductase complex subunit C n=1 Tax=Pseudomonas triclosanedens TaxID=2961893 RepID=A0ABY7A2J7_9PSED|nr:electron transport complex subunit RsxC [Pseudomonas triclosanedens]MCP8464400.1 electron transport complex subunit RsxC [Pseudomonas triclosanedens]MCP8471534.1 electron transport complex subunit RsxC [Pseudomonas triclosanedens]MCP8477654.1 electron transport complex subunit RsxC [Pseudomonas triclosanedens]WAI51110.1 electron transport complex subunit RsxC [Pseudomonas triclosanedens]